MKAYGGRVYGVDSIAYHHPSDVRGVEGWSRRGTVYPRTVEDRVSRRRGEGEPVLPVSCQGDSLVKGLRRCSKTVNSDGDEDGDGTCLVVSTLLRTVETHGGCRFRSR